MLRPTKHSHPDQTIINLSLLLLKELMEKRIEDYESLYSFAKMNVKGGDVLFLPALNFLYLFGVIEYHSKTDSFEYIKKHETV